MKSIQELVREKYGTVAKGSLGCGCGSSDQGSAQHLAQELGYTAEELAQIPMEANLGLSCGNPTAIPNLKPGERVLD